MTLQLKIKNIGRQIAGLVEYDSNNTYTSTAPNLTALQAELRYMITQTQKSTKGKFITFRVIKE